MSRLKKILSKKSSLWLLIFFVSLSSLASQKINTKEDCGCDATPSRFAQLAHPGMVKIPNGTFMMGGDNSEARADELPKRNVIVKGFWMDKTEVTNAQFAKFVKATGYVTTAEKKPDWEELKKQLPPGTPKPPESQLAPASLVFTPPSHAIALNNPGKWWSWVVGANWRHPHGLKSNIKGKDNYPAVQVSWKDAQAYCRWVGKRLPTEAEWEWAARGGKKNNVYSWGNESVNAGKHKANIWHGSFPNKNTLDDGYDRSAPVKSFKANGYGLYDMAGNVWEWVADYYHHQYYAQKNNSNNPKGPLKSLDPREPLIAKRVIRGGSYLCNQSYCSGYRVSARMKTSPDTSMEHLGFRCVVN